ncbi:MAG: acyltransferase [Alphaproteobacteria bacterium]|nr:acyltransferase [Alphaproteobacteria bacterium]
MTSPTDRRADLDWLRVSAFALLILYHSGMAWSGWSWHVTDQQSADWLRWAMRFTNRWRMPLIFLVSGAAVMLALGRRAGGEFVLDRLRRLALPLAFGMLVIVPPQVYAERLHRGQFAGSYLDWLPHAFDGGAYPAGNISWHHLWFVAYVLILTLVLLPLLLWLRGARIEAAYRVVARRHLYWLAILPLVAAHLFLAPISRNPGGVVGDWFGLCYYGTLLLYGALLYRRGELLDAVMRARWVALAIGVAAFALLDHLFFTGVRASIATDERPLYALLSGVNTTAWLLAIVGFARRHLTRRPAFLAYATEAVYPFYILHQTITVIAVYWLVRTGLPVGTKFALAALVTFAGSWLLYEFVVRRVGMLRPLFGLKVARHRPLAQTVAHR